MNAENKRIHVYCSGQVQGVGFRFTVERIAMELGITGWVKNLPDRRVELVGEGKEEDLRKLISKIDDAFSGYVRKKQVDWMPANGEFGSFEIRIF